MPVFGIVPYRTEARTRLEARIQAEVDRLLQVLRTVGDVIRTALTTDRRLLDAFPNMVHPILRPPPVAAPFYFGGPNLNAWSIPQRANNRTHGISLTKDPDWRWGDMQRGQEWLRHFRIIRGIGDDGTSLPTWGTLQ